MDNSGFMPFSAKDLFPLMSLQENLKQIFQVSTIPLPSIPKNYGSAISSLSSWNIAKILQDQKPIFPTPTLDIIRKSSLFGISDALNESLKMARMDRTSFEVFRGNIQAIDQSNLGIHRAILGMKELAKSGVLNQKLSNHSLFQVMNLGNALSAMSYEMASEAVQEDATEDINDLMNVSAVANELISKTAMQQPLTRADFEELKEHLTRTILDLRRELVMKNSRSILLVILFAIPSILDFINNAFGVAQIVNTIGTERVEYATKDDLDKMRTTLLDTLRGYHSHRTVFMEITASTKMRVRPSAKSYVILTLEKGQEVIVLQRGAKWVQISATGNDGVTQYGWALKKYLRPKD